MGNGYVLSVMYYVLRFCCSAVRAGLSWSEMSKMSKMSKACFAGVESFAPLAGPANAGEESMEPENTSQPSLNSQYSQTLCRQGVQNEVTQCPKWEKPANAEVKSYSCARLRHCQNLSFGAYFRLSSIFYE